MNARAHRLETWALPRMGGDGSWRRRLHYLARPATGRTTSASRRQDSPNPGPTEWTKGVWPWAAAGEDGAERQNGGPDETDDVVVAAVAVAAAVSPPRRPQQPLPPPTLAGSRTSDRSGARRRRLRQSWPPAGTREMGLAEEAVAEDVEWMQDKMME